MIISSKHRFAFIHIPKCAGSSVRSQLRTIGDTDMVFEKRYDHPALGAVHLAHLPLWAVRDHYPEQFKKLQEFQSFAICREPHERFQSAVHESLGERLYGKSDKERKKIAIKAALRIINTLSRSSRLVNKNQCIYIPQSHFIYLDGHQFIRNLYKIEDTYLLIREISSISGKKMQENIRHNQTLSFRIKSSESFLRRLSGGTRRVLPEGAYVRLKKMGQRLAVRNVPESALFLKENDDIRQFVESFYKDDFLIYEKLNSDASAN